MSMMIKALLVCLAGVSVVSGCYRSKSLERRMEKYGQRLTEKKPITEGEMQRTYLKVHQFLRSKPFGEPKAMSELLNADASKSVREMLKLWDDVKYQQGGDWRSVQRLTPWNFGYIGIRQTFYNWWWRSADKPVFDPEVYNGKTAEEIIQEIGEIETALFDPSAIKDEGLNQMHQDILKFEKAIRIYQRYPEEEQPNFPDLHGITVAWDNLMEQKGGFWNTETYRFRNPTPPPQPHVVRPPAGPTRPRPQRPTPLGPGQGETGPQTQTNPNDPNPSTSGNSNKPKEKKTKKGGLGAGWIILIIVGSLAVIGTIVYFTMFHGQGEDSMV